VLHKQNAHPIWLCRTQGALIAVLACLAVSTPALADIISTDTSGFYEIPGISAGPQIELEGRLGAEALGNVNASLRSGKYAELIERARAVLRDMPESGLAYEVIGTAEFMLDRMDAAAKALERATEVESGQTGPWTKLGIIQMAQGEIDRALTSLRRAIAIDDSDRFAHQRLGMIFEFRDDIDNAIYHFERGIRDTAPDYLGVAVNLGGLYNRQNRPQRTIALLGTRVRPDTPIPEAHLVLARAYLLADQYDDAYESYGRAAELNSELIEARLGMAISRREAGYAEEALELIDEILAIQPDWRPAHGERAEILLALDRVAAANAAFDRFGSLGGDRNFGQKRVGDYYLERKDFDAARTVYAELVEAGDADPLSYAKLFELYLSDGHSEKGEQTLRDGIRKHSDNAYLKLRLGAFLASLQRFDEALVELEAADRIAQDDQIILRTLSTAQARAGQKADAAESASRLYKVAPRADVGAFYASRLRANNQHEEAAAVYREVLSADPDNALALNNLADLLADIGDLAEAERLARRANSVVEDNPQLMDTLGWVLHLQDKAKDSIEVLSRAAELSPNSAIIQYHLGIAFASGDRSEDARNALTEAIRLSPNADWAQDAERRLGN
jgi:tetratricopeptide (TPR) repeat protein